MAGRLAGKVAVVSGGARGMGASHVQALVDEGANVVFGRWIFTLLPVDLM